MSACWKFKRIQQRSNLT